MLVMMDSFSAKTASGATSDDQKTPRPLPGAVDKNRQEWQQDQRQHDASIMPMLIGRATSNPRTCLIAGIFI
jgi:hypothetical protein